jgi:hypothetical protein
MSELERLSKELGHGKIGEPTGSTNDREAGLASNRQSARQAVEAIQKTIDSGVNIESVVYALMVSEPSDDDTPKAGIVSGGAGSADASYAAIDTAMMETALNELANATDRDTEVHAVMRIISGVRWGKLPSAIVEATMARAAQLRPGMFRMVSPAEAATILAAANSGETKETSHAAENFCECPKCIALRRLH